MALANRMSIDYERVGERLEAIRLAVGMNKGDFARSFGLDESSYSKIIQGKKPLKADYAFEIWEKYSVPMDYIYRGRLTDLPASLAEALRRA